LVKDLTPANRRASRIDHIVRAGPLALFVAYDEETLWRTNGTARGTVKVRKPSDGGPCCVGPLARVKGLGVLFGGAGGSAYRGIEPWRSNGYRGGTYQVDDIDPGSASSFPDNITRLQRGEALFTADDGVHGNELWATEGTAGTTRLVEDINPS
jgi:ELWxxDGT repeat protein